MLWHINLFGTLQILDPNGELRPLGSRKGAELVAILSLRRTAMVDRDILAEALWPDTDVVTARNRLKATLSIVKHEVAGLPIVAHGKRYLELARNQVVIDYEVIERRMKWRRSLTGRNRSAFAKQLLPIVSRGLLLDINAFWVEFDRNRWANLCHELGEDLSLGDPGTDSRFRLDDQLGGVSVPIVGRELELRQVEAWLAQSASRSLHLVGMPGVGKTRLLRESLQRFDDLCDASISLSTVQSSEVPWIDRLGQTLGINNSHEVTNELVRLLADFRRPLIVLDDIDQAGDEMKAWVEELMARVPNLKLLGAARRHPSAPDIECCHVSTLLKPSECDSEATQLLMNFARHFGVKEADITHGKEALAEIAEHLEGLPLALEIAGAWLPIVDPRSLRNRLRSSFDLITKQAGAGRNSLVECVSAICEDLKSEDRDALACLCECHGGCGEALAEEMLGPDWLWRIRTLVDRSLAIRVEGLAENRFLVVQALRESIRSVESEKRISNAETRWREACFSLGERVYFEVNERDRRKWLLWLRDEGDNLVAACTVENHDSERLGRAIRLLGRLRPTIWLIGHNQKFAQVMRALLQMGLESFPANDGQTPIPVVEERLDRLTREGRIDEALRLAASFRQILEGEDDPVRLARALDNEGDVRDSAADHEGAMECWRRCAELFESAGFRRHSVWIESKILGTTSQVGRFSEATEMRKRALRRAQETGDENSVGVYLKRFAVDALEGGEYGQAIRLAEEAVEAFRRAGESVTLSHALIVLASTHLASNNYDEARAALEEAQLVDPSPSEEYQTRLVFLRGMLAGRTDVRLFYDHLTIEH